MCMNHKYKRVERGNAERAEIYINYYVYTYVYTHTHIYIYV